MNALDLLIQRHKSGDSVVDFGTSQNLSHYFTIGEDRIRNSVVEFSKIVKGGDKVLDIGGSEVFQELFETVGIDFDYSFANQRGSDIRTCPLSYGDGAFDFVMSHETIEHMHVMEPGGMITMSGLVNFWREACRVLRPGGIFLVSTRNRSCPSSWAKLLRGLPAMQSFYSIDTTCHAQELAGQDYRKLAKATGLFTQHEIYSTQCRECKPEWVTKMTAFLGRPLKQEEEGDTIWFKAEK